MIDSIREGLPSFRESTNIIERTNRSLLCFSHLSLHTLHPFEHRSQLTTFTTTVCHRRMTRSITSTKFRMNLWNIGVASYRVTLKNPELCYASVWCSLFIATTRRIISIAKNYWQTRSPQKRLSRTPTCSISRLKTQTLRLHVLFSSPSQSSLL